MSLDTQRCSSCGQKKKDVRTLTGHTSDSLNVEVDLCRSCWLKWVNEYGARVTMRHKRNTFRIVDERDIS